MLHKSLRNKRIQNAYTDGKIIIVKKQTKVDDYNTPIPGETFLVELGYYNFRIVGIHNQDKIEYGNKGIHLEREVRVPLNFLISSNMTCYINDDKTQLYDIVKVFPDIPKDETEILLAKEGGEHDIKS